MFTSRCGVACDLCQRKEQVACKGCTNMAEPFWGGPCGVKHCCEDRKLDHCGLCTQFPCDMLANMGKAEGYDPNERLDRLRAWAEEGRKVTV